MAEVLFAMLHDCDIVVSLSSNNRVSVQHAVVASSSKLKLFAEHIAGSLNLSRALPAAQSIVESATSQASHIQLPRGCTPHTNK